jgi:hypothetical protein
LPHSCQRKGVPRIAQASVIINYIIDVMDIVRAQSEFPCNGVSAASQAVSNRLIGKV